MQATTPVRIAVLMAAKITLAAPAQANDSAYTNLDLDNCQTIEADAMGASMLCKGFKGLAVHFKEGDLRQSVLFGPVDRELRDAGFESFSAFNRVNDKIEWRLDDSGKPFAAILRWFIENPGPDGSPGPESTGQVLVVSRIATPDYPGSCFVGMVDAKATANANIVARQVADKVAAGFDCGMQPPLWYGNRGQLTSERTFSWPEGYVVD
ncbi:hypothetical protein J2045_001673 [Peteryoungia aggregata LMG 23059]|uniref:Uncharacterized protein n=1 Tax=Peteryoungia aggregata LMG 23059 TaxID=1368425 RepID=A0ABU0G5M1_9HYPH|nr:hypothetical protein [Peteryoungia aggregata]MDQ0420649.1 hypothetical protein [Peteryoungia aggregata LMG 23059]